MPDPIAAATVVVLRQEPAGGGVQTLMLHKSSGQAFGGMWVFPGGRVDATDGEPESSELDRARHAAVREANEETGITLDAHELVAFAHWTPPPEAPRRFATWFFVVEAPDHGAEVLIDGGEIIDHTWLSPADALARHVDREIQLATPTWMTLNALTQWDSAERAVAAARDADVAYYATRIVDLDGDPVALWAGDVGYDIGDASRAGPRHRLVMTKQGPWSYQRSA